MGVKFGREYKDIVNELGQALQRIDSFYQFFYMTDEEWEELSGGEQRQCVETLADDIFFALGSNNQVAVGKGGMIYYNATKHFIRVQAGQNLVTVVNLI